MVIEFKTPECEQWILQLCNIWQENLDNYEDGQGYINKFGAIAEPDGVVRIIVSSVDVGLSPNWVDPFGHERGVFGLRFIKTAQPPVATVYRLPQELLLERGWDALAQATKFDGDHID